MKKNQDAVTGGIIAVVIGVLGKMVLKKEILPTKGASQMVTTFVVVSLARIAANELKSKYPVR